MDCCTSRLHPAAAAAAAVSESERAAPADAGTDR